MHEENDIGILGCPQRGIAGGETCCKPSCIPVYQSGDPSNRFDIVFLAHKYEDFSKFASDVAKSKDTLLSIEPFKSNADRINIWLVNENSNLGCWGKWAIRCDPIRAEEKAYKCPDVDQTVILTEFGGGSCPGFVAGGTPHVDLAIINARLPYADRIFVHELGHCFGGLSDEYVYANTLTTRLYISRGPNCDSNSNCNSWKEMPNTECIRGCTKPNWYRPTKCSVMSDEISMDCFYFNSPSANRLEDRINKYSHPDQLTGSASGSKQISLLNFNYNKGLINMQNISIQRGSATATVQADANYKLNILSASNEILQSLSFEMPTGFAYDYVADEKLVGDVEEQDNFDFTIAVPYSASSSKINVLSNDTELLATDFSSLAQQGKLYMSTSEGQKQVSLSTEDVSKTAGVTAVKDIALNEENAVPVYSVNGTLQARLFSIIPVSMDIQTKINAENGQVISSAKPWWSFLAS